MSTVAASPVFRLDRAAFAAQAGRRPVAVDHTLAEDPLLLHRRRSPNWPTAFRGASSATAPTCPWSCRAEHPTSSSHPRRWCAGSAGRSHGCRALSETGLDRGLVARLRRRAPGGSARGRGGPGCASLPVRHRHGAVSSPTNWHSFGFGLLCEDRAAGMALLDELFARRPAQVSLWFLGALGPGLEELTRAAETAGYRCLQRTLERRPSSPWTVTGRDTSGAWAATCAVTCGAAAAGERSWAGCAGRRI